MRNPLCHYCGQTFGIMVQSAADGAALCAPCASRWGLNRHAAPEAPAASARAPAPLPAPPGPAPETFDVTASREALVEDYLAHNLAALEAGLHLFVGAGGVSGRQYRTAVGVIKSSGRFPAI